MNFETGIFNKVVLHTTKLQKHCWEIHKEENVEGVGRQRTSAGPALHHPKASSVDLVDPKSASDSSLVFLPWGLARSYRAIGTRLGS
jgi:hypothetical protein